MRVCQPALGMFVPATGKESLTSCNESERVLKLAKRSQEMKVGNHRITTVSNEIDHSPIFWSRQVVCLEECGGSKASVKTGFMDVWNQALNYRIRGHTSVKA